MREPQVATKFGKIVREMRRERSMTQDELAAELDVDAAYVSRIERGRKNVSLETVQRLAVAFKIKVLFGNKKL